MPIAKLFIPFPQTFNQDDIVVFCAAYRVLWKVAAKGAGLLKRKWVQRSQQVQLGEPSLSIDGMVWKRRKLNKHGLPRMFRSANIVRILASKGLISDFLFLFLFYSILFCFFQCRSQIADLEWFSDQPLLSWSVIWDGPHAVQILFLTWLNAVFVGYEPFHYWPARHTWVYRGKRSMLPELFEDLFCQTTCLNEYSNKTSRRRIREELFDLEGGVCVKCGLDCHALVERIRPLPVELRQAYVMEKASQFTKHKRMYISYSFLHSAQFSDCTLKHLHTMISNVAYAETEHLFCKLLWSPSER